MDYVVSTPTAEKDAVRLQIIMSVLCPSHGCGQWVWEFFCYYLIQLNLCLAILFWLERQLLFLNPASKSSLVATEWHYLQPRQDWMAYNNGDSSLYIFITIARTVGAMLCWDVYMKVLRIFNGYPLAFLSFLFTAQLHHNKHLNLFYTKLCKNSYLD